MLFDSYCSIIFYLYLLHYSPTDLSQYYVKISTETNIILVAVCITSVEVRKLPDFHLELKSSSMFASGELLGLKSSLFPQSLFTLSRKSYLTLQLFILEICYRHGNAFIEVQLTYNVFHLECKI